MMVGLRGKPNQQRQAMIDKAFQKFDKDGNGYITTDDIRGVYNCKFHPKVQDGSKTEEEVYQEFLANFDSNADHKIERYVILFSF